MNACLMKDHWCLNQDRDDDDYRVQFHRRERHLRPGCPP